MNQVAKWDGSEWSALSGPTGTGIGDPYMWDPFVAALVGFDDGSGEALFAGGRFITAGGVPSWNMASWSCLSGFLFADDFETGDTSGWFATVP